MIKIKLVKISQPKIIARRCYNGEYFYDCACSVCGYGVGEGEKYCACCGNEIDWKNKKSRKLKRLQRKNREMQKKIISVRRVKTQ